ncbi:hypothetical protein J1N35_034016 [Gossypium stocksii]|uniref:Uncharacterized protein n=1 Tax=Gossypium stocksii TaxID=47602 RepID=A0A9D3UR66_9ROSI|nr:hypothetical protein J1N35_034016 [Gossypium stocksii]
MERGVPSMLVDVVENARAIKDILLALRTKEFIRDKTIEDACFAKHRIDTMLINSGLLNNVAFVKPYVLKCYSRNMIELDESLDETAATITNNICRSWHKKGRIGASSLSTVLVSLFVEMIKFVAAQLVFDQVIGHVEKGKHVIVETIKQSVEKGANQVEQSEYDATSIAREAEVPTLSTL